jgi:hypothetical protein
LLTSRSTGTVPITIPPPLARIARPPGLEAAADAGGGEALNVNCARGRDSTFVEFELGPLA